jgi:hypothetical protein
VEPLGSASDPPLSKTGPQVDLARSKDMLEDGEISSSGTPEQVLGDRTGTIPEREESFFDSLEVTADPEVDRHGSHMRSQEEFL